jgi:hypothetical protein
VDGKRILDQTGSNRNQQPGLLNVKRKHKIELFTVITICLLIPMLSAYADYYVLTEADFFSAPQLENPDLDCLLLCKKQ